jgi:amino acid transporter
VRIAAKAAPTRQRAYRKSLGIVELVSLGLGGTIGSGIFVTPGVAAGIAGPSSLLVWILVGASATAVALALAWIQAASPAGMRFNAMFTPAFGRVGATVLSIVYIVSSVAGIATIAAGLGQYVAFFGIRHTLIVEIGAIAVFLGINIIGIKLSGTIENVLTGIKMLALIAIALMLLPFVRPHNLLVAPVASLPQILAAAIVVYWPFTGFEISAIPVAETRAPGHIARALVVVMAAVCVVYLLLNLALIGAVGSAALAASPAPVAYAAGLVLSGAGPVVAVIGIVTMLSALNAYIVGTSRVLHDVAETHGVPSLGDLSHRGVPAPALLVACVLSGALLFVSNRFEELSTVSVIVILVPYIAICIAALRIVTKAGPRLVAWAGMLLTAGILVLYVVLRDA